MKIIISCILSLLLLSSCSQKPEATQTGSDPTARASMPCDSPELKQFKSLHSKSMSDFSRWTKSWKESDHKLEVSVMDSIQPVKYFTIPFEDIKELGSLEGTRSVRAYIGKTSDTGNEFHLLFVPVCDSNSETSDPTDGDPNYDVILDYTTICPTRCGDD